MALIIAASGLFAMAAVLTQRRSHEIAVRKVLGASRMRITAMLLAAFVKPVLTGALIAWPAAYLAARAYLGAFVEPVALTPVPFLLCLVGTLTVVVATVCGQASRAAAARPFFPGRSQAKTEGPWDRRGQRPPEAPRKNLEPHEHPLLEELHQARQRLAQAPDTEAAMALSEGYYLARSPIRP